LAELRQAAPIGFALADPGADAWQAANPHLLRAQALGLAGRRVGGPPPRRERIAECHSPGRPARMPRIVEPARYLWRQCRTLARAIVLLFQLTGWIGLKAWEAPPPNSQTTKRQGLPTGGAAGPLPETGGRSSDEKNE
jgi:hypothetical protein